MFGGCPLGVKKVSFGCQEAILWDESCGCRSVEVYLPYSNATKARKSASLACLLVTILKILIQPINKL